MVADVQVLRKMGYDNEVSWIGEQTKRAVGHSCLTVVDSHAIPQFPRLIPYPRIDTLLPDGKVTGDHGSSARSRRAM